ncbi:uncharacterized protein LOC118456116 isoform X3 [Neolamprologus brichardi]|uniref:uncharacterized protein LOC118456116 isoform X3 n=1 Tax=Neolamprologus brichardi TaxID=32507 RepID=UPI0016437459|nr:uncharacterized protein LOC118456116 isoform X3 [Neolamprologus brichardi]
MLDTDTPTHIHRLRPQFAVVGCFQVILFFIHIAQLIMGALNLHDCPREPFIPIYLLVIGVVTLLFSILQWLKATFNCWSAWSCLVSLFVFCWFIAGNLKKGRKQFYFCLFASQKANVRLSMKRVDLLRL